MQANVDEGQCSLYMQFPRGCSPRNCLFLLGQCRDIERKKERKKVRKKESKKERKKKEQNERKKERGCALGCALHLPNYQGCENSLHVSSHLS